MRKLIFILLFPIFFIFFLWPRTVRADQLAQEEALRGKVTRVLEEKIIGENNQTTLYQNLQIEIVRGSKKGEIVDLTVAEGMLPGQKLVEKGDLVLVSLTRDDQGKESYYLSDFVRYQPLIWLFLVFIVLVVGIGGWQGFSSLLGLLVSFLVVIYFLVPQIASGQNPVLIAVLASLLIIPVTFYLSHGFNKKTSVAIAATTISLLITISLTQVMIKAAKLSGFVSEEVGFLQSIQPGVFNWQGLLLAGVIVGVLGVLDDVTVSQAAIVQQLKRTDPHLSSSEVFSRAMKIGKDHIASMVNTLVLVYAGAALPLLLLFYQSPKPFLEVINYEIFAEEIVRMLAGSIGLVLAVPITTLLAANVFSSRKEKK